MSSFPDFSEVVKLLKEHRIDIVIALIILVFLESLWFGITTSTFLSLKFMTFNQIFIGTIILVVHVGLVPTILLCGSLLLISFIKDTTPQKYRYKK